MNKVIEDNKLECLAVLGSHARGDDNSHSDVDLLGIVTHESHQMINVNKVNLAIYSENYLRRMMRDGELFSLHIINEGIPLVNGQLFHDICSNFEYKKNYSKDRKMSFLMGEMILKEESRVENWHVANKRIAWCIRTYILSLMAEGKNVSFSKEDIAFNGSRALKNLSYQEILELINAKQLKGRSSFILELLKSFMNEIEPCKPSKKETEHFILNESILRNTLAQMMFESYT